MNKMQFALAILTLLGFLTAGCQGQPTPAPCPAIQPGLAFLDARFNNAVGLLNEAPQDAPNTYWLTNDNALAAYALAQLGQKERAVAIQSTLQYYGHTSNNLIEVVWGATVAFPPHVARPEVIARVGEAEIRQEFHDAEWIFTDWREYANLGFLGALNEFNQGRKEEARSTFSATLAMFDGSGLRDKAFSGQYETYKLALALYTGARIGAPVPNAGQLRQALLSMQATNGGFYTHYRTWKDPEGDANTETTALALLALKMVGCSSR